MHFILGHINSQGRKHPLQILHQKMRKWVAERYMEAFQKKIRRKNNDTEKIQGGGWQPPPPSVNGGLIYQVLGKVYAG